MISYAKKLTLELLETLYSGSYFAAFQIPIEEFLSTHDSDWYIDIPFSRKLLSTYKKNLSKGSGAIPHFNYIYRLKDKVNCLDINNEKELSSALQNELLDFESVEDLKSWIDNNGDILGGVTSSFFKEYSGYTDEKGILKIQVNPQDGDSVDNFLSIIELVDGNAVRFDTGTSDTLHIPDFVIEGLKYYTTYYDAGISRPVREWLEANFKKPYKEITLYRGCGMSLDDASHLVASWGDDISLDNMKQLLKEYFGVSDFTDIVKGGKVILHRGQESSWSTKPQVSQTFAGDSRGKALNIMVKTTLPASAVLIDLNLLPKSILKQVSQFWTQNEVIVKEQDIPATISTIYIKPNFINWLEGHGYTYQKGVGIRKS